MSECLVCILHQWPRRAEMERWTDGGRLLCARPETQATGCWDWADAAASGGLVQVTPGRPRGAGKKRRKRRGKSKAFAHTVVPTVLVMWYQYSLVMLVLGRQPTRCGCWQYHRQRLSFHPVPTLVAGRSGLPSGRAVSLSITSTSSRSKYCTPSATDNTIDVCM